MKMSHRHLVQSTIPWQMHETQHDSKFTQLLLCVAQQNINPDSNAAIKHKSYTSLLYNCNEKDKSTYRILIIHLFFHHQISINPLY